MKAIAKDLRESILQAAIQGKLTKTLDSDTPVSNTIDNFRKEKLELLELKKMRDRSLFKPINESEYYFEIPDTWQWVRINDIGIYKKGPFGSALTKSIFVKKNASSVKIYEQKNAIQKNEKLGDYYISKDYFESKMSGFTVEGGDIIVSCAGTIGETFIMPSEIELGIINQALMRMNVVKSINTNYFMLVFDHILKSEARIKSGGTAIKNIPPFEVFKAMPIPLPPIEEQERIVARVDELMCKVDEYEKIENQLLDLQKKFPKEMKTALLNSAMQGKFLGKNWNIDDKPEMFIPLWKVTAWDKKFKNVTKGKQKEVRKYHYYLAEEMKALEKQSGDVFLLSTGDFSGWTTEEAVGRSVSEGEIVSIPWGGYPNIKYYKGKFITSDNRIATSTDLGILSNRYLYYFMLSKVDYLDSIYRGTGLRHPDMSAVLEMLIPLPSVLEQELIVKKLDLLLPMCESLIIK